MIHCKLTHNNSQCPQELNTVVQQKKDIGNVFNMRNVLTIKIHDIESTIKNMADIETSLKKITNYTTNVSG